MGKNTFPVSRSDFLKLALGTLVSGVSLTGKWGAALAADNTAPLPAPGRLIASFSRTGTTRAVAMRIQQKIGGTLFAIRTVTPYPESYRATTAQASDEQQRNDRPPLAEWLNSMDGYDQIFIGYPIWWGTMPMAVFTFLEHYAWQGKQVIPFCTHEGSAFGRSVDDLAKTCRGATLRGGLALHGGGPEHVTTPDALQRIDNWAAALASVTRG